MSSQILPTKFYIPPPNPNLVARQRLINDLQAGASQKLTLVSAPAGYGKTTLLSAWIHQIERPVAWLSLDEYDNEIGRFLDYFIAAIQTVETNFGRNIPKLHSTSGAPPAETLLVSIINEIINLNGVVWLVLDDYHMITSDKIHHLLCFLFENLPPNLKVVISSRTDPPIQLARMRSQGDLSEIRANDLRFTRGEAVEYFQQRNQADLITSDIHTLVDKTEGWITGLQLASISLQNYPDQHAFIHTFAGDNRHVADYLFEEVLGSLPEHVQSFLLDTCILDRVCASLCQAVTDRTDSQEILATLDQANIFLIPLDNRRSWFRYHRLFADLLKLHLKRHTLDKIPILHQQASIWYENEGFLNLSVEHAIQAGDINRVERFVQENTLWMLDIGETATIDRWLTSLPSEAVKNSVWLTVAKGWTLLFLGNVDAADQALGNLESRVSENRTDPSQMQRALGQIAALRAYIADLSSDLDVAERYALEALDRLSEDDQLAVAFASMMLATVYMRKGDTRKSEANLQRALPITESRPYSFASIDALCMLSKIQHLNGQLHESVETLEKAREISLKNIALGNRQSSITGLVYVYLGQIYYEWNHLEQALAATIQGLEILEVCGFTDCVIVGLIHLSLIHAALGDINNAFESIHKSKRLSRHIPYWLERVKAYEAFLISSHGSAQLTEDWLSEQKTITEQPLEINKGLIYRSFAQVLISREKFSEAARFLEQVVMLSEDKGTCDRQIRALVLYAAALLGSGDEERAISQMTKAINLAAPGGYKRVFLDTGTLIPRLMYKVSETGIHPSYCMEILREAELEYQQSDQSQESKIAGNADLLVEPLSNREIEVLGLIASGLTNQEIAQELILSLYTIKSHARNIYSKLGVKNRTEAVARARILCILSEN